MNNLIIIRGLPSSGKSTLAKQLAKISNFFHMEADMFFINKEGVYEFDISKIKEAHAWCQKQTKDALERGRNVVVSNTFTQEWEIAPYREMWDKITIINCRNAYGSIHNIPEEAYNRMKNRWEDINE